MTITKCDACGSEMTYSGSAAFDEVLTFKVKRETGSFETVEVTLEVEASFSRDGSVVEDGDLCFDCMHAAMRAYLKSLG